MIEFGGDKIGNPFHGLYRASTGKISTPGGVDIDAPAVVPSNGNCWLIQIPGLPEPVTTDDETEQGKTWLNYALIAAKTLYGVNLSGPIYIDPEGRPWQLGISHTGSRATKSISVGISARRFGLFASGTAPLVTLPPLQVAFNTHPDYPVFANEISFAVLLDVAKNSGRILIGVSRIKGLSAVAEVVLSGSPGSGSPDIADFSAEISLLADESGSDDWSAYGQFVPDSDYGYWMCQRIQIDWTAPPSPYPSGDYPTHPTGYHDINGKLTYFDGTRYSTHRNVWMEVVLSADPPAIAEQYEDGYVYAIWRGGASARRQAKWIAAARYGANWTAEVFVADVGMSKEHFAYYPIGQNGGQYIAHDVVYSPPETFTERRTQTMFARVYCNDELFDEVDQDVIIDAVSTGIYGWTVNLTRRLLRGDDEIYSRSFVSVSLVSGGWYDMPMFSIRDARGVEHYSSSLIQVALPLIEASADGAYLVYNYADRIFGDIIGRLGRVQKSAGTTFASEHPVTGEIAQGSNVVCWL